MGNELNTRSVTNKRLLRVAAAGGSAEDMAAAVNNTLTPAQALKRVKEMLSEKHPLDWEEQSFMSLLQAKQILDEMWSGLEQGDTKSADLALKAIRLVQDLQEKLEARKTNIGNQIHARDAGIVIGALTQGFELAVDELTKRFPDADPQVIRTVLIDATEKSVSEIRANTQDEF